MPTESMSGLYVRSKIESDVARSQTQGEALKYIVTSAVNTDHKAF